MLRLLILFLILRGSAATSEDMEGNSSGNNGDFDDDEDLEVHRNDEKARILFAETQDPGASQGRSEGHEEAGGTLVIIIAAVSVAVLAIGGIAAIVLFRRYLQSREQGVYSVPAEQGQKAAV